jgi:hypothetical protein
MRIASSTVDAGLTLRHDIQQPRLGVSYGTSAEVPCGLEVTFDTYGAEVIIKN